jgi:hypothetical protein
MSRQAALIMDRLEGPDEAREVRGYGVTWGRTETRRLSHVNNLPQIAQSQLDRYQQDRDDGEKRGIRFPNHSLTFP